MRRLLARFAMVTLGVSLIMLAGCASSRPTSFYVLTALPSSETMMRASEATRGPAVGLGPVTLPKYLDRSEIVTRASQAKLNLGKFDQWAAPLQHSVSRVLAENLSMLIPTDHMVIFPWQRSTSIDYQIVVDITRFDGERGEQMVLIARWSIIGTDNKELMMKKSHFSASPGSQNYEATVTAMSRTLEALSREMAAALQAISQKASAH